MQIATFVNYVASGGDDAPSLNTLLANIGPGGTILLSGACQLASYLRFVTSGTRIIANRNSNGTAGASLTATVAQFPLGSAASSMIVMGRGTAPKCTIAKVSNLAVCTNTATVCSVRNGDIIYFPTKTGSTLPTGLSNDTRYYAVNVSETYSGGAAVTTYQLAITAGGSAVGISDTGGGGTYVQSFGTYFYPGDVAISSDGTNPSSIALRGETLAEGTICFLDAPAGATLPAGIATYIRPKVVVLHYNANGRAQFYPARGGPVIAITGTGTASNPYFVCPALVGCELDGVDLVGFAPSSTDDQCGQFRTLHDTHLCRLANCNITNPTSASATLGTFSTPVSIVGNNNTVEFCYIDSALAPANTTNGNGVTIAGEGTTVRYNTFTSAIVGGTDTSQFTGDVQLSSLTANPVVQRNIKTTGLTAYIADAGATGTVTITPNP